MPEGAAPRATVGRDREATEQRLVDAVGAVLAREGFQALGVNAVAKQAGVDKVLIYRYFGGLPDLLRAYGERGGFWPTDEELVGDEPDRWDEMHWEERWAALLQRAVRSIRARPLTHEILAWEMVGTNELTEVLEEVREAQFRRLIARYGADADHELVSTAVAVVIAATNYLVARGRHIDTFAGLALDDDDAWRRVEALIPRLLASA